MLKGSNYKVASCFDGGKGLISSLYLWKKLIFFADSAWNYLFKWLKCGKWKKDNGSLTSYSNFLKLGVGDGSTYWIFMWCILKWFQCVRFLVKKDLD